MQRETTLVYRVPWSRRDWELSEEKMPESVVHDQATALLVAILAWWAAPRGNMQVARNLAVRWDEEEPRVGVEPDVSVLSPAPPGGKDLRSVRTWLPGHTPPLLAVEIVSTTNPHKDYVIAPEKYAASGTRELWIFDPTLEGPKSRGGPFRLQIWQRDEQGRFVRAYAGEGPFYSDVVGAYVIACEDGSKLRIAADREGRGLWPTGEEAERAEKEAAQAAAEAAQAAAEAARAETEAARIAAEAASARVAELEAKIAELEKGSR